MQHERPRLGLEHYRKDAKAFVRAFRSGDTNATARAMRVLGSRAEERFLLSDAQYVVASEHGHRSWGEFRRALETEPGWRESLPLEEDSRLRNLAAALDAAKAGWGELGEVVLDGGGAYVVGEPVRVRVRKRGARYSIDDDCAAVARAGRPNGWHEVATCIADGKYWLNVNRRGAIFVPAVEGGVDLAWLVLRVADASVDVYQALVDLDDT